MHSQALIVTAVNTMVFFFHKGFATTMALFLFNDTKHMAPDNQILLYNYKLSSTCFNRLFCYIAIYCNLKKWYRQEILV